MRYLKRAREGQGLTGAVLGLGACLLEALERLRRLQWMALHQMELEWAEAVVLARQVAPAPEAAKLAALRSVEHELLVWAE
jgi:hypothetical protein